MTVKLIDGYRKMPTPWARMAYALTLMLSVALILGILLAVFFVVV